MISKGSNAPTDGTPEIARSAWLRNRCAMMIVRQTQYRWAVVTGATNGAFGAGYTSENGRVRANLSGATTGGSVGVGAGISVTLN